MNREEFDPYFHHLPQSAEDSRFQIAGSSTAAGSHTMNYNHQLCLIPREIWPWAVHSMSDWKNEYHPECIQCSGRQECGGFFFSAKYRHSENIQAIIDAAAEAALLAIER